MKPSTKRSALLGSTALAAGVLAGLGAMVSMPRPAMAASPPTTSCNDQTNMWTCAGTEPSDLQFTPTADFWIHFGPDDPFISTYDGVGPAVTVNAGSYSTTGDGIRFYPGTVINNSEDGALSLSTTGLGDLTVNINGASESEDAASLIGLFGIYASASEGGSLTINNDGHVQGTDNDAIYAQGFDLVTVNNHSYGSVVGAGSGDSFYGDNQVIVDNQGGLTASLSGLNAGLYFQDIYGASPASGGYAVDVNNTEGGIVAGYYQGIHAASIGLGGGDASGLRVNNAGSYDEGTSTWIPGGLIAGVTGDGINVNSLGGNLYIVNNFTREGSIDLTSANIDSQVAVDGGLLENVLPSGFTTGIFGAGDGIFSTDSGGAYIHNQDGQIVGAEGDGIDLNNVSSGWVEFYNNTTAYGTDYTLHSPGGSIWGGIDGVDVNDSTAVYGYNDLGWITGVQNGIELGGDLGVGETAIGNLGGTIFGYYGIGIDAHAHYNDMTEGSGLDRVGIYNGGSQYIGDWASPTGAGYIIGGDTAINIDAYSAWLVNGGFGAVVGDGQDSQPVLNLYTSDSTLGGSEGDYPAESAGAFIFNDGVLTSKNNPNFSRNWGSLAVNEMPSSPNADFFDWSQLKMDTDAITAFAMSGGASSSGDLTALPLYAQTASDLLVNSEGGAGLLINGGGFGPGLVNTFLDYGASDPMTTQATMFGRVVMTGATAGYAPFTGEGIINEDGIFGNVVVNLGQWYTTNTSSEGGPTENILSGDGTNIFFNNGFIQTAFQQGGEYTSFQSDRFYNGDDPTNLDSFQQFGDLLPYQTSGAGWLSMVDNEANDVTNIFADYYGTSDPTNFQSYLAVDANFANAASDVLLIGGIEDTNNIYGSTGIVVNKLNTTTSAGILGTSIPVVLANGYDMNDTSEGGAGNVCFEAWCKPGDTFFISSMTPGAIKVSGSYFIPDGMFMWGLTEIPEYAIPDPTFNFVATYGPDAADQAALTTGAQNAFYSNGGVVDDHQYGNDYPQGGQGGGGADLPYASPDTPYTAPPAHHRSALWGRMTGTWANQDSSFTSGGLTFDTSFAQHDYGLLAGIEMRPPTDSSGWRLGLYGGWTSSGLTFSSYGASANYNGGTVGAYAAYLHGPLHIDAEFKADFLGVDYSSPSVSASTTATNLGVLTNAAWRTQKGNFYYEPIVSFDFVNTSLGGTSGGGATITYSDGQSVRAGIGGRIGTSLGHPGGEKIDLDLMAKVWNEFGGPNTVTVSDGITTQSFTDSISGLYGEVSGRATIYSADRMWSGFAEASGKFSSKVTSVTAKVGARRNF